MRQSLAVPVMWTILSTAAVAQDTTGIPTAVQQAARDPFVGTFVGRNFAGPVTVDIERMADGYVVVDRSSATPMRGEATVGPDGVLRGEYVVRVFRITRRHHFELTPDGRVLRYKVPGATTVIERYARTDEAPESEQWLRVIGGARLASFDRYNSGGGGGGYTREASLDLCADGRFHSAASSSTSISGSGISGSSNSRSGGSGTWRIVTRGGATRLELRFSDGNVQERVLGMRDDAIYLDSERWLRDAATACR